MFCSRIEDEVWRARVKESNPGESTSPFGAFKSSRLGFLREVTGCETRKNPESDWVRVSLIAHRPPNARDPLRRCGARSIFLLHRYLSTNPRLEGGTNKEVSRISLCRV